MGQARDMLWRGFFLLLLCVTLSVLATIYFGQEVLIAIGLIVVQLKVLLKKLVSINFPAFFVWIKVQTQAFFRVELIKRWLTGTLVPLVVGRTLVRRFQVMLRGYVARVRVRYDRMLAWFHGLSAMERAVAWLVILFATLALSVTSLGLWLVLFSVQIPLWLAAAFASLVRMTLVSVQKALFKAVAFLQLTWLWRLIRRLLPKAVLQRKRRIEFRMARAIVRRRRLTLKQLVDRKDRLPFRLGLLAEYLFYPPGRSR